MFDPQGLDMSAFLFLQCDEPSHVREIPPMKLILQLALFVFLIGCSSEHEGPRSKGQSGDPHAAHAKAPGVAELIVQADPAQVIAGEPITLKLMIHGADGKMVNSLETVHQQKLHLIVVRDGLDHFAHLHPDVDTAGNATATYTFPTGGNYWLYADHKPTGKAQAAAMTQLKVAGDSPAIPVLAPNVPGEISADGLRAKVAVERATGGGEATITFDLTDAAGKPVEDLQPYMGARGHLVVLSSDGKQYVHAHPVEAKPGTSSRMVFRAHTMKPGLYKGWGQFRRQDTVQIVPFVFEIGAQ